MNPRPADYESAAIPLSHNGTENVLYQIARNTINKLSAPPPGEAVRNTGYEYPRRVNPSDPVSVCAAGVMDPNFSS